MTRLLEGRVISVTGAGAGLGRAYARACGRAGASVVVNDVDSDAAASIREEIRAAGGAASVVLGSVADWEVAERVTQAALEEFGRLDGCVANAGIKHEARPWEEGEPQLRRIVGVNVLGVMFTARHAMAAMALGGGGSLVTVVSGARFGIRGQSAYGATKGAVAAMTQAWALEGERIGVRVNGVSPLAETPMASRDLRGDRPHLGAPDAVAPLVVALLSDATREVNGATLRFDGRVLTEYGPAPLGPANGTVLAAVRRAAAPADEG